MRNEKQSAPKIKKIKRVWHIDLLDENFPAWNYSISGQTGSGTSVLMNALLTTQFDEDNKDKKDE